MAAKRKTYLAVTCALIVAVGAQPSAEGQAPVEPHWGPVENLERVDLRLPGTARKPADLAAYNLSDHAFIDALCGLAQAAARVRVYLDAGQLRKTLLAALPSHPLYRLAQASNVEVSVKQAAGLMHLKSYLVDSQVLRTGSTNFSTSGLKRQDNDVVVIRDARSIAQFAETFERLWARPDNKVWRPER